MSEYTAWVHANLAGTSAIGTNWDNLNNAEQDNVSFAEAVAAIGKWVGSPTATTENIRFSGNNVLDPLIPSNAEIDQVECRMHFDLPVGVLGIANLRVNRSSSYNDTVFAETLLSIPPTSAGSYLAEYDATVSNSEGRAIAQGGDILPVFCSHTQDAVGAWQLNLRYCEFRLRFTRAPNVPRTTYIAMF